MAGPWAVASDEPSVAAGWVELSVEVFRIRVSRKISDERADQSDPGYKHPVVFPGWNSRPVSARYSPPFPGAVFFPTSFRCG